MTLLSCSLHDSYFILQRQPNYSKPVLWTGAYCVASCGGVTMDQVKQYGENQREIAD
jgi:putative transposase